MSDLTREQIINELAAFVAELRGVVSFEFNANGVVVANKAANKIMALRAIAPKKTYLDGLKEGVEICYAHAQYWRDSDAEGSEQLAYEDVALEDAAAQILFRAEALEKEQLESENRVALNDSEQRAATVECEVEKPSHVTDSHPQRSEAGHGGEDINATASQEAPARERCQSSDHPNAEALADSMEQASSIELWTHRPQSIGQYVLTSAERKLVLTALRGRAEGGK